LERTPLIHFLEAAFLTFKAFFWSLDKEAETPLFLARESALFYLLASLALAAAALTRAALGLSLSINLWFLRGFFF
jgi:hypothetical protein